MPVYAAARPGKGKIGGDDITADRRISSFGFGVQGGGRRRAYGKTWRREETEHQILERQITEHAREREISGVPLTILVWIRPRSSEKCATVPAAARDDPVPARIARLVCGNRMLGVKIIEPLIGTDVTAVRGEKCSRARDERRDVFSDVTL